MRLLASDDVAMGHAARDRVMRDYAWSAHLKVVEQALDRTMSAPRAAGASDGADIAAHGEVVR